MKTRSKVIAYITAQAPYGRGETFIIDEMITLKELGVNLLIFPRNPSKEIFHLEGQVLLDNVVWLPLINLKMVIHFFISLLTNRRLWKVIISILRHSNNWRNLIKNLVVLPKGVYIAAFSKKNCITHIHAHWSTTTSTIGYIVSQLSDIPWSFTAHSGMILWNNMIKEKVKTASFVRVISKNRYKDLIKIAGPEFRDKVFVLHMGTKIPPRDIIISKIERPSCNIIGCIGNLNKIKGHRYLIEACSILKAKGFKFKCLIIGEGEERHNLEKLINNLKLHNEIELVGSMPHSEIITILQEGKVDLLVLPSITLPSENRAEGIPLILIEAMANGIPVVSTETGSIPELIAERSGILVPEKNSEALAEGIIRVLSDGNLRKKLIIGGYNRVNAEFNMKIMGQELIKYLYG